MRQVNSILSILRLYVKFIDSSENNSTEILVLDDPKSIESCVEFIDKYITCARDEEGEMDKLIGYQIHNHTQTCKKGANKGGGCRFNFPRPPMNCTQILKPLSKDYPSKDMQDAKKDYQLIQGALEKIPRSSKENVDFNEFVTSLGLTCERYITAVRSSLNRTTVFLRRQTSEIYVNNYNKKALLVWRANMDIQFILDPYACAKYCVGYMLKAEGGVSKLLRALAADVKRGNTTVQSSLQQFAKILINGGEISAQEAAAFVLSLANICSSRVDIYVNTAEVQDRIGFLKPSAELETLDDESTDICVKGLLDHYVQRPEELEDVCLADFASLYNFTKKKPQSGRWWKLDDDSGYVTKRKIRKILRFRHYQKSDERNYWREQIMLFLPWRNEERDLIEVSPKENAERNRNTILENSAPFYSNREVDENALGEYINEIEQETTEVPLEEIVQNEMEQQDNDDYATDMLTGSKRSTSGGLSSKFLAPKLVDVPEYMNIMRTLNKRQRRIVMDLLSRLKTDVEPFHVFLSGGAGVGKSRVITAIVQSYLRFCNKQREIHPDDLTVLVTAFTGKAAFNVFGMTLHTAFCLNPSQKGGDAYSKLDEGKANTLRLKFRNLKLVIIDEISMVSSKMFEQVNLRLQQIFQTNKVFGGKSVLVVGHLRQLPPISGGRNAYVFVPPKMSRFGLVSRNPTWEHFKIYEVVEIMRQKDDMQYCKALNNQAEGVMDSDDIKVLKSREINEKLQPPSDATWLFQRNKDCDEHNKRFHEALQTEGCESVAHDAVKGEFSYFTYIFFKSHRILYGISYRFLFMIGSGSQAQKEQMLEDAKNWDTKGCDGSQYTLRLQVGGTYFVTTNIDVSDGLFNGATGLLKHIKYGRNSVGNLIPVLAWIKFDHPLIGQACRQRNRLEYNQSIPADWTPIQRISKVLNQSYKYENLELNRTQIPVKAANAMTIAKSQGSSIPKVVVSFKRRLSRENAYVACSRGTTLDGFFVHGTFTPPDPPCDTDVVTLEMKKLMNCPYNFKRVFFEDISNHSKIYFHNVENLHCYFEDMKSDPNVLSSDIIFLVEPHVTSFDAFNMEGFTIARSHPAVINNGRTNSEGFVIYNRNGMS